jgi:hypothetical protein
MSSTSYLRVRLKLASRSAYYDDHKPGNMLVQVHTIPSWVSCVSVPEELLDLENDTLEVELITESLENGEAVIEILTGGNGRRREVVRLEDLVR